MTRLTRLCRAVGVGLAVAAATLSMTQVAHAGPAAPTLPDAAKNIAVDPGNKVFLVGRVPEGKGVQIYKCVGTAWVFDAPSATLVGDNGKTIIEHGRGPTWTATDGSSVLAERVGDPVTVDPTAIPWLLLRATKTAAGPDGDRLARTTFIQRVNTTGGLAPKGTCDPAVTPEARVPYTADYIFWKATGKPSKPGA